MLSSPARARQTRTRRADRRERMGSVGERKKRSKRDADPLAPYRRIRKPMPPPQKVIRDHRRDLNEEEARREIEGER